MIFRKKLVAYIGDHVRHVFTKPNYFLVTDYYQDKKSLILAYTKYDAALKFIDCGYLTKDLIDDIYKKRSHEYSWMDLEENKEKQAIEATVDFLFQNSTVWVDEIKDVVE